MAGQENGRKIDPFQIKVQRIGNSQTEMAFLAYLYKDPAKIYEVCDLIRADAFISPLNATIYQAMLTLAMEEVHGGVIFDRTLIEHKVDPWPDPQITPNEYFDTLAFLTPEQRTHGFGYYVEAIYTDSTKRKLALEIHDVETFILTSRNESVTELLTHVDSTISNSIATFTCPDVPVPITTKLDQFFEEEREEDWTFSSGFPLYDEAIGGGLAPGTFHVIMGRSGAGKSSFLLAAATAILKQQGIPILYLDTELAREQVQIRWLAMISGIEERDIRLGSFRNDKIKFEKVLSAYQQYKEHFGTYLRHIKVAGWSAEQIIATMRRWYLQFVKDKSPQNKALVVYDYLKSTSKEYGRNIAEYQALGNKLQLFHDFAANYRIPIISGAQVNREGIIRRGGQGRADHGGGRVEDHEGTLAMSDRIMWFSDSLSLWRRKTEHELNRDNQRSFNGDHILITMKARFGPGHDYTVEIANGAYEREHINYSFDKERMQIRELNLHSHVATTLRNQLAAN